MAKVPAFLFRKWDIQRGDYEPKHSTRYGTREAIRNLGDGFSPIESSKIEIDDSLLGREEPGLTDREFTPEKH